MSLNIETVWSNILKCENESFMTIRGFSYTYKVYDCYILINNDKKRRITKNSIARTLLIKNPTPSKINAEGIWGSSYIYGIITDNRINNTST